MRKVTTYLVALVLMSCAPVFALDVHLEARLGSVVGPSADLDGDMPAWFELYASQEVLPWLDAQVGVCHRSNADKSGDETDFECAFTGVSADFICLAGCQGEPRTVLYGRAHVVKSFGGDQSSDDLLYQTDAGVRYDSNALFSVKLGGFWVKSEGNADTPYELKGVQSAIVFNF